MRYRERWRRRKGREREREREREGEEESERKAETQSKKGRDVMKGEMYGILSAPALELAGQEKLGVS